MKLQVSTASLKTQLNALKERLQPRLGRILVIATDGCTATGAAIRGVDGQRLEIEALATSRAIKFEAVAEELVAGLKAQGTHIPKQVILLTASMIPAVLELPVAANKNLAAGQMMDMIRWELEPLFAQQISLWSIGSLLFGRGYLAGAERQELLDALQPTQAVSRVRGGGRAAARFGELAIEKGFASREQIEECLALQEELQMPDADMLVGWYPSAVGKGLDSSQSAWLCAGISPVIRTRWVDALERVGLHVLWIYPLAGTSAPLAALSGLPVALELHPLLGICYRQKDGAVAQLSYRQFTDMAMSTGEALLLTQPIIRPDDRQMAVYSGKDWGPALAETLTCELKREIVTLGSDTLLLPADCEAPDAVLAALSGGAAHTLGMAPSASAVRLAGSRPPPPAYKQPTVWMGAAAALLLALVIGFEANSYLQQRSLTEKRDVVHNQQVALEAVKKDAEKSVRAEQEAKKNLEAAKTELEIAGLRKNLYERALGPRNRYMGTLLDALIDLINDELLLENVAETGWQRVEIRGFALNVEAVYRYARMLAEKLEAFGVKLGELDTHEHQGPLNLIGYQFSFVLLTGPKKGNR
jgi:hypothetical protein